MGNYNSRKRYVATVWTEPPELRDTPNEFRGKRSQFDALMPAITWCTRGIVTIPHATGQAEVYDDHEDETAWTATDE